MLLAGCSHAAHSTQIITDGAALGLSTALAAHSPVSILFASPLFACRRLPQLTLAVYFCDSQALF